MDLELVAQPIALHLPLDASPAKTMLDEVLAAVGAKRAQGGEQVDRLQPVRLSLAVLPDEDDGAAGGTEVAASEIAETLDV